MGLVEKFRFCTAGPVGFIDVGMLSTPPGAVITPSVAKTPWSNRGGAALC